MTSEQASVCIFAFWAVFTTLTLWRIAAALENVASRLPSTTAVEAALRGIERLMPRREVSTMPGKLGFTGTGMPRVYSEPIVFPEAWVPPVVALNERGEWEPKK